MISELGIETSRPFTNGTSCPALMSRNSKGIIMSQEKDPAYYSKKVMLVDSSTGTIVGYAEFFVGLTVGDEAFLSGLALGSDIKTQKIKSIGQPVRIGTRTFFSSLVPFSTEDGNKYQLLVLNPD